MYSINDHLKAIEAVKEKEQLLQDPLALCNQFFGFRPNEGQSLFLEDIQNPALLGHLIQTLRGGGKTIICAAANCWAALNYSPYKSLILSGSFEQARTFYNYVKHFIELCPPLQDKVDGEPLQSETRFRDGGFIKCLTASEKSSRSPHVDWLFIDEFVLVKRDLINAAFPTVRTSKRPKRIFLTTASQTQACVSIDLWYDFWDNANEMGFRTYQWDIGDCPWIDRRDLELAKKILDPMIYATEYLGERAERTGAVFKRSQIQHAVESASNFKYEEDLPTIGGIDWGVVHPTVATIIQPQGEYNLIVHVEAHSGEDVSWWCDDTLPTLQQKYKVQAWYCDAAGKPFNTQLKNRDQPVVEVPFNKYKDQMIGEVRRELEYKLLKIPAHFKSTVKQLIYYTYDPNTGKPIKMDDDYTDSTMLGCWGASGRGLDQFDLFDFEQKRREEREGKEWWRKL